MILSKLNLQNFRNYKEREFSFSPTLTVIIGPNTAGKTNLLEALYLIATGSSFRAAKDSEMIMYNQELARLQVKLKTQNSKLKSSYRKDPLTLTHDTLLEIVLTTGSVQGRKAPYKRYLVNGVGRRKSDFTGNFYAVLFHPQDIELVTDSPSRRRAFLDNVLVQTDREYSRALTQYEKVLRRRNKLLAELKEKKYKQAVRTSSVYQNERMEYWDRLLVENGKVITREREKFVGFLNKDKSSIPVPREPRTLAVGELVESCSLVQDVRPTLGRNTMEPRACTWGSIKDSHVPRRNISRSESVRGVREKFRNQFKIEYNKSEISYDRLRKYREEEVAAGYALVGPQRDDFVIQIQNPKSKIQNNIQYPISNIRSSRELSAYGSRGEQRLAVLWLKLGELAYLEQQACLRHGYGGQEGEKPILLLDDIFSELDHENRKLVADIIPEYQTVVTTVDEHYVSGLTNIEGIKIVKNI